MSTKNVVKIATRVAKRLDKKKAFQNWQYSTSGTYFNSDVAVGRPLSTIGISNRPDPFFFGMGSGNRDVVVPRQHADEQAGEDLIQTLTHLRKSNRIYVDGITIKGVFLCPATMGQETVRLTICEVKIPFREQATATALGALYNASVVVPEGSGFIKPSETDRATDKNTRIISQRSWKLSNLNAQVQKYVPFVHNVRFKKPKLIEYADDQTSGELPLNRYFWAAMSAYGWHDSNAGIATGASPSYVANAVMRYHEKLD